MLPLNATTSDLRQRFLSLERMWISSTLGDQGPRRCTGLTNGGLLLSLSNCCSYRLPEPWLRCTLRGALGGTTQQHALAERVVRIEGALT